MPASSEIIDLLTRMSRELAPLAIAWHAAILVLVAALVYGWRPSKRAGALLLLLPVFSVAIASLAFGSPFNAITFSLLALVFAYDASRLDGAAIARGPRWTVPLGVTLVAFAWGYPHFVPGLTALYAAPIGIAPCPTLALLAGATLLAGGFGTRAVPAALTGWTAFYALFGVVRLGVWLDAGLLVAAAALAGLVAHSYDVRVAAHRA